MAQGLVDRQAISFDRALGAIQDPLQRQLLIDAVADAVDIANEDDASIVLLAARRMTCIYELLRASGLPAPSRGTVVSDRFIELLPARSWTGDTVHLVDDTTVTGKTLSERAVVAARLTGDAASVRSSAAIDLTNSPEEVGYQLHRQLARAFGEQLVPFFTDFPVSGEKRASARELEGLLSSLAWRTVDVTNAVTSGTGSRAYSLFPSREMLDDFERVIGPASNLVDIAKVRLYTHDDGDEIRLRVVPIVIARPVRETSLHAWLAEVGIEHSGKPEQSAQALGLVAFALARQLFSSFVKFAQQASGLSFAEDLDFALLTLGAELSEVASSSALAALRTIEADGELRTGLTEATFDWPSGAKDGSHYANVGDDVAIPGFECLQVTQSKIGERRARGWESEATTLSKIAESSATNLATASLAIDVLNDLGYAVPASLCHGGVVFRGYRAGEAALRPIDDIEVSRTGGKLAAFTTSVPFPDSEYFEEPLEEAPQE